MAQDAQGLGLSTSSAEAAAGFARTLDGYIRYRADTAAHLAVTLAADPEFALAHCLKGYFAMLSFNRANVATATDAAGTAR